MMKPKFHSLSFLFYPWRFTLNKLVVEISRFNYVQTGIVELLKKLDDNKENNLK